MIMGNFARTWSVQEKEKAWWKRELVSGRGNVTVSTLVCSFGYPSLPYCSDMDRECFKMFWTDVILKKKTKTHKNRKCRYVPPWRNLNDFFEYCPAKVCALARCDMESTQQECCQYSYLATSKRRKVDNYSACGTHWLTVQHQSGIMCAVTEPKSWTHTQFTFLENVYLVRNWKWTLHL